MINEDEEKVTIEFAVKDTGIGIAAHKIDSIFENFPNGIKYYLAIVWRNGIRIGYSKTIDRTSGWQYSCGKLIRSRLNI